MDFGTFWAGYVGSFVHAFVAFDDVELDFFVVTEGAEVFLFVIFDDGGLMYKNVLFCVISMYKTVAISNVEPFDRTHHSNFYKFFIGHRRVSFGFLDVLVIVVLIASF